MLENCFLLGMLGRRDGTTQCSLEHMAWSWAWDQLPFLTKTADLPRMLPQGHEHVNLLVSL
jgi:hypothetical protein